MTTVKLIRNPFVVDAKLLFPPLILVVFFLLVTGWAHQESVIVAFCICVIGSILIGVENLSVPVKPLSIYFLFSIVFYSHRYILQWGPPETTQYDLDTPESVRIVKDIVWLVFLLAVCFRKGTFKALRGYAHKHRSFLTILAAYFLWMVFSALIRVGGPSLSEIALIYVRYPLEYMVVLFLVPCILRSGGDLRLLGRAWIVGTALVLGFFAFEFLASRSTGFDWGGIYRRYGSIFGSPNDFGIFCGISLIGLTALWNRIQLRSHQKLVLLGGLLVGILFSLSRSAWILCCVGLLSLCFFKVTRRTALIVTLGLAMLLPLLVQRFGETAVLAYAAERLSLASEESAQIRMEELQETREGVAQGGLRNLIFGFTKPWNVENYYASLLIRAGLPALLLFISILVLTLWRTLKLLSADLSDGPRRCILIGCFAALLGMSLVSAFVPYPDVFPTNLYLWMLAGTVWRL